MSTPQTTPGTTTIPPINKVLQRLRWQEFEMICIRKSLELVRELIELADMEDDEGYNLFEEDKGEAMSVINESFITAAAGVF